MTETEFDPHHKGSFDENETVSKTFGEDVVFLIAVRTGNAKVELKENQKLTGAVTKPDFPKDDIKLDKPDQITVLDWSGSPGCKTVIINGKPYDKC